MRKACLALLLAIASAASAVEVRVATFNIGAHFGTTYFDYSLGDPGTADYESVKSVLARINADVVALQEIHAVDLQGSPNDLQNLAAALGYTHVHVCPVSGAFDTVFQVAILSKFPFITEGDVVSPPGAKELSRLHPLVKVDVPGTPNDLVMAAVHLKSETTLADRFRRAVEVKRLVAQLSASGVGNDDNFVVLGDFNPSSINATFNALPTGLPASYVLGSDMTFPISYSVDPTAYFSSPAAVKLDPRQPDGSPSTFDTAAPNGPTLDLMLVSPAIAGRPAAAEVYNSALDVSNSVGLPKVGAPPASTTSQAASDHYAVFADLNMDDAGPYVFNAPGQTVTENFSGFSGNQDPLPWVTSGGFTWRGVDAGSSNLAGLRSYGTVADPSLGFLPQTGGGTTATATFINQSPVPLTALRIALDCEQWRAAQNGTADSITAELVTPSGTIPLPGLTFSANTTLSNGPVAGGATTARSSTVTGLSIPHGASCDLRFSFNQGPGGGATPNDVFINEFHYDNTGADEGEFVEIAVAPGYTGALSDLSLLLYNGLGGVVYGTHSLGTFTAGATTASGHRLFSKTFSNILQNGAPDGFAVVNTATSQVLHFISYEGVITATAGPAAGMTSTDIGVSQNAEVTGQAALGLTGTGGNAADFTWTKFTGIAHSPGQPNNAQNFILPTLPSQGLAIDNLGVTFLSDHDQDGVTDESDPDDDNDGQPDAYEAAFGSDPLDAASRFSPVLAKSAASPHGFELSFPGAAGVSYTVETSADLVHWQDLTSVSGVGETLVVPLPATGPQLFFRVRAGE